MYKHLFIGLGLLVASLGIFAFRTGQQPTADQLQGAWRLGKSTNPLFMGKNVTMIVTQKHFIIADYDLANKRYFGAISGTYSLENGKFNAKIEMLTYDSTLVGMVMPIDFTLSGNEFTWKINTDSQTIEDTWQRIDEGAATSPLFGTWRITGRQSSEGKMGEIQRGARKTIKVLSGSRFHWAAINTETKQFFGCGGGTYKIENGKYVEQIEFFSRDNSRVGASLGFDFEVKARDWHHKGLSSKGDPIYEIWSLDE